MRRQSPRDSPNCTREFGPIDATRRDRLLGSARTTTQSREMELTHRVARRDCDAAGAVRVVDAVVALRGVLRGVDVVGVLRGVDVVGVLRGVDVAGVLRGVDGFGAARLIDATGAASVVGDLTTGLAGKVGLTA